jgi:hypothetical protein
MSLVLDASVTAARVHIDETTQAVLDVFDLVADGEAWVPSLWHLEIANVFQFKIRKAKYDARARDQYLSFLSRLPILTDDQNSAPRLDDDIALIGTSPADHIRRGLSRTCPSPKASSGYSRQRASNCRSH